jgi:uncharacterized protein
MHLVIDGYNLIRQSEFLRQAERQGLEAGRKRLIEALSAFKKARGHAITVVFDGWDAGSPIEERTREGAITIVYSRQGEKADDVIRRIASKGGRDMMVVTSDRELAFAVSRRGVSVMPSHRFEETMMQADAPDAWGGKDSGDDDDTAAAGTKKKGPSKKLPKSKRALDRTAKRL